MSGMQNIAMRLRFFVGFAACGWLFLLGRKRDQIEVLDFLASQFAPFRGAATWRRVDRR